MLYVVLIVLLTFYSIWRRGVDSNPKHSKYIPPYLGSWKNNGDDINENFIWIEPKLRKRYVNVMVEGQDCILKVSWNKYRDAVETRLCEDQREVEIFIDLEAIHLSQEHNVIIKYDEQPCYINVIENKNEIILRLSYMKEEQVIESIHCFGSSEVEVLIPELNFHYGEYSKVTLEDREAILNA